MAMLASVQSSMGSIDGLALPLLQMAVMGETLAGRPSREASTSSHTCLRRSGRGEASDLWGGDATASTVVAFPMGQCSNLQLDSSDIARVRRSSTSAAMLTLVFGGVLGELAAGMVCASST